MKRNHFILFIFLLGLTMVSCSEGNDMSVGGSNDEQTAQQVDLLVNVGSRAWSMSAAVHWNLFQSHPERLTGLPRSQRWSN